MFFEYIRACRTPASCSHPACLHHPVQSSCHRTKARTCRFSVKKLFARHGSLTGITFFHRAYALPKILAFVPHAARCGEQGWMQAVALRKLSPNLPQTSPKSSPKSPQTFPKSSPNFPQNLPKCCGNDKIAISVLSQVQRKPWGTAGENPPEEK